MLTSVKIGAAFLILFSVRPCAAEDLQVPAKRNSDREFYGRVVQVRAGDRLDIKHHGRAVHFRVYGVLCPVGKRADQAREFTHLLASGRGVDVQLMGHDGHGSELALIHFLGGKNLGEELVRAGMARWNRSEAPHEKNLARLEAEARLARRGLWADQAAKKAPETSPVLASR